MTDFDWLPPLLTFDWNDYPNCVERAYEQYQRDFGTPSTRPQFRGLEVRQKYHPEYEGKSGTFWHLVTEGKDESARTPVRERFERVAWPRVVIEQCDDPARVCCWLARRNSKDRWHLALADFSYLVVLADHKRYVLLWTAFFIERHHQRDKLRSEFEEATKRPKPPLRTAP